MVKRVCNELGHDLPYLKGVARLISERLEGKVFDIVSFHSIHNIDSRVLERYSLKNGEIVVDGSMIKIPLSPRRSIAFDLFENPVITIESERQIKIVRRMNQRDTIIKIILINEK